MQSNTTIRAVDEIVAGIEALDLEPIKVKLMDPEEGQGWTREHAERIEVAYRRYLVLLAKYPHETFAPSRDVDRFWHGHILDTMKYGEDCQRVFGYFLHHFPYFGMRGEADAQALAQASRKMSELYAAEFGEAMPASGSAAYCIKAQDAAYCIKASAVSTDAAYCIKAQALSAYCIKGDAAYCIKSASLADTASRPRMEVAA